MCRQFDHLHAIHRLPVIVRLALKEIKTSQRPLCIQRDSPSPSFFSLTSTSKEETLFFLSLPPPPLILQSRNFKFFFNAIITPVRLYFLGSIISDVLVVFVWWAVRAGTGGGCTLTLGVSKDMVFFLPRFVVPGTFGPTMLDVYLIISVSGGRRTPPNILLGSLNK